MYTFNEYQKDASRTMNKDLNEMEGLMNGVMGLNGEAGEVIDIVKKHLFQGHEFDRDKVIDECSDVFWYIAQICEALNIEMESIAKHNIEKLHKRYPDGFSTEASVNRNE